jgi:hypothetical protein
MVACCTKVTLSDDNVRNLTASYAMKEQPMSKSFLNALFFFFLCHVPVQLTGFCS